MSFDRNERRALEAAIAAPGLVGGSAVTGLIALLAELRDAGHLSDDAIGRIGDKMLLDIQHSGAEPTIRDLVANSVATHLGAILPKR